MTDRATFNSALKQEEYKLLKIDAIRKNVSIRSHIAAILRDYIEILRKEGLRADDTNDDQTKLDLETEIRPIVGQDLN
jgi:hypothetical protein